MKTTLRILALCAAAAVAAGCMTDAFYETGMFLQDGSGIKGEIPEEDTGNFDEIVENSFISTADEPVSTFSVDADGASYSYIRKCILNGFSFNRSAARIEEFINYFPFNYAEPAGIESVALNAEVGQCPWAPEHRIIRLGMKGKSLQKSEMKNSNYVFLIDVSGSMDSDDKLGLLKEGLTALVDSLNPDDRISIITYSGSVRKVLESTRASESKRIKNAIKSLSAGGSTAGGQAMKMAYEEARANLIKGGNNRVIMGTDGDFNVGVTDTDQLLEMIQDFAEDGIYLTICGFGWGNLNDSMMETLSNKGNGTYEFIADAADMEKIFVREVSKFHSVANDCKVQVTFNPEAVAQYRLIGYENRKMSNEDFEDDGKDAAEIGAGQTVTALYEIIPAEGYADGCSCATFDFRYKKSLGSESRLLSCNVAGQGEVSESFNFACSVAAFGMILRNSEYKYGADIDLAISLASSAASEFDPYGYRTDFISLMNVWRTFRQ